MKQGVDGDLKKLTAREVKVNPELTQDFVKDVLEKAKEGTYKVEVRIGDKVIPIDVYPEVFPPKSDYSVSSRSVYETFGNLENTEVVDVGSGTGMEAIVAAMAGASHVDAVDINDVAVECTEHNVRTNDFADRITVRKSDLFSALPKKKYGLIIANLPIVDYRPTRESGIITALYDPDLDTHKRMLQEAKGYLAENGMITFTHSNLQSGKTERPNADFDILENMVTESGYEIVERKQSSALEYTWINYKIKLRS